MRRVEPRCMRPGCGHGWPAHSGPTPACTAHNCDCEKFIDPEAE